MNGTEQGYTGSPWHNGIIIKINNLEMSLDKKTARNYRTDLLKRVARRIDEFSASCSECQSMKDTLNTLVEEASHQSGLPVTKAQFKSYHKSVELLAGHLKKTHKLIEPGMYLAIGISIGVALGAGISTSMGQPAFSGIGIPIGVAIGLALDNKAKKEGRVL